MQIPELKVGSDVKRQHIWDGTSYAGKPIGPVLTVTKIRDHRPCDGPIEINAIAELSDGSWSFVWNLTIL
jgi:hypothetical protein